MDSAEIKRRYEAKLRKLQELEARAATYREREEALPRRLRFDIAELRTEVEELRLWGHRAHLKEIREAMGRS